MSAGTLRSEQGVNLTSDSKLTRSLTRTDCRFGPRHDAPSLNTFWNQSGQAKEEKREGHDQDSNSGQLANDLEGKISRLLARKRNPDCVVGFLGRPRRGRVVFDAETRLCQFLWKAITHVGIVWIHGGRSMIDKFEDTRKIKGIFCGKKRTKNKSTTPRFIPN